MTEQVRIINRYSQREVRAEFKSSMKARHCENCNLWMPPHTRQLTVKGFLIYYLCERCADEALDALDASRSEPRPAQRKEGA